MRKLFWCCTAAGVLAVGGVCAVAHHAGCPASIVSRGAVAAAALIHPLTGLGLTAGRCTCGPAGEETAARDDASNNAVPPEPKPVAPEAVGAPPTAVAHGPSPIVIREEEPTEHEESGTTGTLCPPATIEPSGERAPPCPATMPYCTDEGVPTAAEAKLLYQIWLGLFGESKVTRGGEETAEPARAAEPPSCQEDAHYHEHYSGCPYTGYHLPSKRCPVTPVQAEPGKHRGEDECCEEPAPKKHKVNYPGKAGKDEECPKHPEVDTMEYRRSDGSLSEYGPGPF